VQQSNSGLKDIIINYEKSPDVAYSVIPSVPSKHNMLEVPRPQSNIIGC